MIDPKNRELFVDAYHLYEYYEKPPFVPGAVEENANWFKIAAEEKLIQFLAKWQAYPLAADLALAILSEANRQAVEANKAEVI